MNEENQKQNEKKELPDQIAEQVTKQAANAVKDKIKREIRKKIIQAITKVISQLVSIIVANIIPILIIVAIFIIICAADSFLDGLTAETVDEVTHQTLQEYCTIDDTGIHFDKEEFLKNIVVELANNGIDLNEMGLGDDGNSKSDSIKEQNIDPNSQAAQYLYKFITASLAGELPYIEGSDKETQGIIKIKRKKAENQEAKDLTYIGYQRFQEMLKSEDNSVKEQIMNYFSLDQSWNLCVAKQYKETINGELKTYTVSEVKIPYRTMVSQYTVPFLFLIDLQVITTNANYVEAVSELMTKQSEIEFTIFDSITTDELTYNYKATRHTKKRPEDEESEEESESEITYNESTSDVDETTTTFREIHNIKANVTKAKTWLIEQETNYELQTNKEYPYGANGQTNELPDGTEPEGEGSWDTDRTEHVYQETIKQEWMKSGDTNTKIKPSTFMGLWSNETGTYVKGSPYKPVGKDKPGKIVSYQILNSSATDRPIITIITAKEQLYELLEDNEKTQTHAELMKEMINFYLTGKELTDDFGSKFKDIFDPDEFEESDWCKIGSGFWWPINDTSYTTISSPFGYRGDIGVPGASKYHKGIDIPVPQGTEIIASADGVVEVAGFSNSAGNWIRINHGNGIKTVYMHNSKLLVTVGQNVKQGDIIALSGNTGNSGGPHLHFGVEVNGEYVDPLDYVDPNNPRPTSTIPDVPVSVEAWRPYISQAFSELGYTMTEEKVGALLRQIETESHGDQTIIQGIVDSNSGKPISFNNGVCPWCPTPSGGSCGNTNIAHGLLQFIPTTFYANMVPGHTNIFNGYDQICACISMLEKRPGSYTDYIGNGTGWG